MQPEFEQQWRAARTHENNGDPHAAWSIYQTLIRDDPDRLYVRLRLSALEQSFGHYRASREHALCAADTVRKGRWADLAPVARRLLSFGEDERVRDLVAAADWSSADVVRASAALSQYLWLAGYVEEALRLVETARVHAHASHLLSYSRANALRYMGKMAEATAEYERCIALKPDFALAHWSLAYHARSEVPGSRIDRLRRVRERSADTIDQPYLDYALFKEYDAEGDIPAAWQSLQEGAQCKRRQTPYSPSREQQGFDALHRLFGDGLPSVAGSAAGAPAHTPIFIVGMPRTGTTLLERIIGSHAGVRAAGELNDFNHALSLDCDRFPEAFVSAPGVDALSAADPGRVGATYLHRTLHKAGGNRYLIDKNPMNLVNAGFIGQALPNARILCLRRSPMDACFSNLKELFSNDSYGYSYVLEELAGHYRRFTALSDLWQQVMPRQFMLVDYEALVSDPERTARRVVEFCGMDFEPASVDITSNTSPVATASSSQVRQPIHRRGVEAWRRYARQLEPLRERLGVAATAPVS